MLSSSVLAMKLSPEDVGLHELVKRADIMLLGLFFPHSAPWLAQCKVKSSQWITNLSQRRKKRKKKRIPLGQLPLSKEKIK